ncbi:M23 family metallopeptidase [Croceicoccus bisphenolivorans]|uniref:M23 family metallopeptidase n=1 Tax=Croceicoccus bisphenolivorans TaxID=1783232 RepID=UPI001561A2D5|nr:M23 family metallopeptidase [Croceicoccus bisphenolivorans]
MLRATDRRAATDTSVKEPAVDAPRMTTLDKVGAKDGDVAQTAEVERRDFATVLRQFGLKKGEDEPWVSDLADGIGSPRWYRSLAFMLVLIAIALALWPDFNAVQAAPDIRLTDDEREEYRAQMITPLALGADTGKRMGPSRLVVPLASAPERPVIELTATMGRDGSLENMLRRAGVGSGDAEQTQALINEAYPVGDIEPGTGFQMRLGRRESPSQPRPLENLTFRARFDLQLTVDRAGGPLALEKRVIRVDDTPLRITGKVGSGLYRSARAAGVPARSVQQYLKALDEAIDLDRDVGAGDDFDVIIAYKRAETGEVEVGDVLYAGLSRRGTPRAQMLRWGKDKKFYDANGAGEMRSGLVAPTNGSITSRYGMRRHPILGYKRMHAGVDFRARTGQPIYAVTDGTVNYASRKGGFGNFVRINHGGGLQSGYAHLSRFAVSSGQRVKRGQVIGYAGSTGLSTGPHLHYELYRGGKTIDPLSVQFVVRAQLSADELRQFRAQLLELKKVKPGAALEPMTQTAAEPEEPQREIDRLSNAPA